MEKLDILELGNKFRSNLFKNEDDIKLNTYSDIILPIQKRFAPDARFLSEYTFAKGGRADGTIGNLVFEYKRFEYFNKESGINEALYGRSSNKNDSGLYQYIISSIEGDIIDDSILDTFGIGFDGQTWIIARFAKSLETNSLDLTRTRFKDLYNQNQINCQYVFQYKKFNLYEGIEQLITLFTSTNKTKITKDNLNAVFNPKNEMVANAVRAIYSIAEEEFSIDYPKRTSTLFNEWNKSFGAMFGHEDEETEFNETTTVIKKLYNLDDSVNVDMRIFLFATQTFFNIVLKLLIDAFIRTLMNPGEFFTYHRSWSEITELFEGSNSEENNFIDNFFEIHYYEWFTYLYEGAHQTKMTNIIQDVSSLLNKFDLATFKVRPESVQDILQEIYMTLIPDKFRHLLGEYFSPDWIVEHALNRIGYQGQADKKLLDPTCGSGAFIIQAIKRYIKAKNNNIDVSEAINITKNIVGIDLNPISAVSAKANYILTLFSSLDFSSVRKLQIKKPITIPIYIADSVLSPIVFAEESIDTFTAKTTVGDFVLPKFKSFEDSSNFLNGLGYSIANSRSFSVYKSIELERFDLSDEQVEIVKVLYEKLNILHRTAQDSFWGKILKNSFAPVMLKQGFDYVVGNPPWIAWKAMSKVYRAGTLDVWKSYGIFEKNAYDKKTTHDDFGMAVTYVALDQYLKNDGHLYFLLPWTFLKSTKGGEGFRKFSITRNEQNIPIKVELVDDFNDMQIFKPKHTVRTIGVLMTKGKHMNYPMKSWFLWSYREKRPIGAHDRLNEIINYLQFDILHARPINSDRPTSSWLTLRENELKVVDKVLLNGDKNIYKGRKGIEPAGAKGVYILKELIRKENGLISFVNDMSRQRRKDIKNKGEQPGIIEETYIYPMLGGRNIQKWKVVSNEYMLVPHNIDTPYGLDELKLAKYAPKTYKWLEFYKEGLLASRIQNGKFYNPDTQPWYRLDNVGEYTFSKYKVIWKEQSSKFAAVAIGTSELLSENIFNTKIKPIVVDSKVLLLATESMDEAYYIAGIINSGIISSIIDAYAIGLNRGTDILENIKIPKYDWKNDLHVKVSNISKKIHELAKNNKNYGSEEDLLNKLVAQIYSV